MEEREPICFRQRMSVRDWVGAFLFGCECLSFPLAAPFLLYTEGILRPLVSSTHNNTTTIG